MTTILTDEDRVKRLRQLGVPAWKLEQVAGDYQLLDAGNPPQNKDVYVNHEVTVEYGDEIDLTDLDLNNEI